MKPINSKERSKLFWQFFFIFIALGILPVAIIFYAYRTMPEMMSDAEQQKLVAYSNFEHSQKALSKNLSKIDSCIILLNNGSNVDAQLLTQEISADITALSKSDSTGSISNLVSAIYKGYSDYFTMAKNLSTTKTEAKKASNDLQKTQDQLQKINDQKAQADAIANTVKSITNH